MSSMHKAAGLIPGTTPTEHDGDACDPSTGEVSTAWDDQKFEVTPAYRLSWKPDWLHEAWKQGSKHRAK